MAFIVPLKAFMPSLPIYRIVTANSTPKTMAAAMAKTIQVSPPYDMAHGHGVYHFCHNSLQKDILKIHVLTMNMSVP